MLPIDEVADEVCRSLVKGNVVLQAEPGAGKSTRLPLAILEAGFDGKILMLEPRRLAAQNVAARLASQLGESLGQRVGLRMRGRTVTSKHTQLEVVTEGVLTRILQSNPLLEGFSVVLFDEFHERSLHADFGLALCLDVQREVREDLRLLLMSATLDGDALCSHLGVKSPVSCKVRQHPVEIIWHSIGRTPWLQVAAQLVHKAVNEHIGDVLVFLPGVAEIEKVARLLKDKLPSNATVHRLHRGVNAKAQAQATATNTDFKNNRRIILSTSIAETSLTIDGVSIVIDSGVERRSRLDTSSGIERLETVMASKASATQRAGRAGRTQAGVCYRLWSEESHATRAANWQAEILRVDLSALLLEAGQWGVTDVASLPWVETPPQSAIEQAKSLLVLLELWCDEGLTARGRAAAKLPVEPRIAHMLLWAEDNGAVQQAAAIAALIEDLPRQNSADLSNLLHKPASSHNRRSVQLASLLQTTNTQAEIDPAILLARAFPDRIAKRRTGGPATHEVRYQLSGGSGAVLHQDDPLTQHEYIVIASLGGKDKEARVFSALAVDLSQLMDWCEDLFQVRDVVQWDEKLERVIAEQQQCVGALVTGSKPITDINSELRTSALISGVRKKGLSCLNWTEDAREWQARVLRMRALEGEKTSFPAVDDDTLLNELETWLQPYLTNVSSLKAVRQIDLMSVLVSLTDYSQQQQLDTWLPKTYKVPSGAQHKLRYSVDGNPVLAVKLQEMFGCRENPSVAQGRLTIKVELLSPARRPVQVTEDLGNFWHNSYPDVKKDLAGRYPKHPWPDDPLSATATAHTKPRKRR